MGTTIIEAVVVEDGDSDGRILSSRELEERVSSLARATKKAHMWEDSIGRGPGGPNSSYGDPFRGRYSSF